MSALRQKQWGIVFLLTIIVGCALPISCIGFATTIQNRMVTLPEFTAEQGNWRMQGIVSTDPYCNRPVPRSISSLCTSGSLFREQEYYVFWIGIPTVTKPISNRSYTKWHRIFVLRLQR